MIKYSQVNTCHLTRKSQNSPLKDSSFRPMTMPFRCYGSFKAVSALPKCRLFKPTRLKTFCLKDSSFKPLTMTLLTECDVLNGLRQQIRVALTRKSQNSPLKDSSFRPMTMPFRCYGSFKAVSALPKCRLFKPTRLKTFCLKDSSFKPLTMTLLTECDVLNGLRQQIRVALTRKSQNSPLKDSSFRPSSCGYFSIPHTFPS